MQFNGIWLLCDDDVLRPVVFGEILNGAGAWVHAPFLVDTGADRTVLSAALLAALQLPFLDSPEQLAGVGGAAASVSLQTQLRLTAVDESRFVFEGRFAAFTDLSALDMSVLG